MRIDNNENTYERKQGKTLYEILEVSTEATTDEIKKQYRKMAIKFHPDKNPNDSDAEEKFKEIADAYQILSDYENRKKYDYELRYGLIDDTDNWVYSNVTYQDPNELFAQLFDNLSNNLLDNIFTDMGNSNVKGHLYVGIQGMPVLNFQHLGVFENIIGMDAIESFGPLNINAKYDDVDLDINFSRKNPIKKVRSRDSKSPDQYKTPNANRKTTVIKEKYPIGDFNAIKTHKITFKINGDGGKNTVQVPLINHKLLYPGRGKNNTDLLIKISMENQSYTHNYKREQDLNKITPVEVDNTDYVQCDWVREKHNLICHLSASKKRYKNGDHIKVNVPGKIKPVDVHLQYSKMGKTKKLKGLGLPKINMDDDLVVVVDDKLLKGLENYRRQLSSNRGDLIFHLGTR